MVANGEKLSAARSTHPMITQLLSSIEADGA